MASFKTKRLGNELQKIHKELPPGITLVSADDLDQWLIDIRVLDGNPIYDGQIYRIHLRFSAKYPMEAPGTSFVALKDPPRPIPLHPHIYSNGIVCLDLLGTGWSPAQNVESICVSLQSMLTSNTRSERPEGDEEFCRRTRPGMNTRGIGFVYDDDGV